MTRQNKQRLTTVFLFRLSPIANQYSTEDRPSCYFPLSPPATPSFGSLPPMPQSGFPRSLPTLDMFPCESLLQLSLPSSTAAPKLSKTSPSKRRAASSKIASAAAACDRPCGVCGNKAGQHCHYGAAVGVCDSCRVFFRRAVQSGNYSKFACTNADKSGWSAKSCTSCQWCRYQNCLKAGMKVDSVLMGYQKRIRAAEMKANQSRIQVR
jgi:hypothetical protein